MHQSVKENFSKKVEDYESHARLQKEAAGRLAAALNPWKLTLPEGDVLELGAGTGFLTRELYNLLPGRRIVVTDISEEMLSYCRMQFDDKAAGNLVFEQLDAEKFSTDKRRYALVASNFVAQWFRDPAFTLGRFAESLEPGGLLLSAFPGHDSFPEWREKCTELGIPYTGNDLPNTEELVIKLSMGPSRVDFYEDPYTMEFPDSLSFFRYLKKIGANSTLHNKQLTAKQFRLLVRYWDESVPGPIKVTWHLVFLALKKDL